MAEIKNEHFLVEKDEMENFMERCMLAAGSKPEHAKSLAACLIAGDNRGHFSHGLNRLEWYIRDLKLGSVASDKEPVITQESPATALVDGNNLLGPVVGSFCMKLAIKKAKEVGIGLVCCNRSNHYGIAGFYSMQALEENLIGMSFTNTSPIIFPTRGSTRTFGTNPITFAAPGLNGDSFVLDMATSTVALGKVEINQRKGLDIPNSWGADEKGYSTTNPAEVINVGGLFPLGGDEITGGYKGYGLTFMVEILCGILAGGNYGPNIRTWQKNVGESNIAQCFIAIDPKFFAPNFEGRLQDLMNFCRNLEPMDSQKPILVPGDPERNMMNKAKENNGISYHVNQIIYAENIAKDLNIVPPKKRPDHTAHS